MSVFAQTEEPKVTRQEADKPVEPVKSPVAIDTDVLGNVPHETDKNAVAANFWQIVEQVVVPDSGRSSSIGVGLKPDEHNMLNEIVQQTGAARNALVRYAVRKFIQMYQSEMIELEFEKPSPYSPPTVHKKLKM